MAPTFPYMSPSDSDSMWAFSRVSGVFSLYPMNESHKNTLWPERAVFKSYHFTADEDSKKYFEMSLVHVYVNVQVCLTAI